MPIGEIIAQYNASQFIEIRATANNNCWLVLSNIYYLAIKIMIDDIKIKIYRADVNAWAIYVSICIAISLILIKISTIIVNSLSR